ncbi:hypothetical protein ACFWPV_03335 [Streptomyces uncialis]|uniref:hypothetical protein n=1 Tax=Streptomyces uncialis TaxID=1048205 RepID=UPI00365C19DA
MSVVASVPTGAPRTSVDASAPAVVTAAPPPPSPGESGPAAEADDAGPAPTAAEASGTDCAPGTAGRSDAVEVSAMAGVPGEGEVLGGVPGERGSPAWAADRARRAAYSACLAASDGRAEGPSDAGRGGG